MTESHQMTEHELRQWAEKCPPRGSEPIAGGDELARATLRVLDELAEQRKRTSRVFDLAWDYYYDDGEWSAASPYVPAEDEAPFRFRLGVDPDGRFLLTSDEELLLLGDKERRWSTFLEAAAYCQRQADRICASIQAEGEARGWPSGVLEWSFDASHGQWLAYGGGGERWRICMSASGEFVGVNGFSPTLAIAQAHCQNHADLIARKV